MGVGACAWRIGGGGAGGGESQGITEHQCHLGALHTIKPFRMGSGLAQAQPLDRGQLNIYMVNSFPLMTSDA